VESQSYTTSDILLSTETAFIVEVKVQCDEVSSYKNMHMQWNQSGDTPDTLINAHMYMYM
jgi:hypothetical protein